TYYGEKSYDPATRPLQYSLYEGNGPTDLDYGRSIANLAGNLLYSQRDYLAPVPLGQIRLNEALKQNPGW
ncbi:MAG: RagB/SusD family nutrient uptake outer membrane protein, partial [Tannerella sp.]|nr:RagB/SusD family nutrient uptake outer membrane protein [Tannerella sp.]